MQETDIILMGTVDETAATFGKMGGTGVAVHVDHAQARRVRHAAATRGGWIATKGCGDQNNGEAMRKLSTKMWWV